MGYPVVFIQLEIQDNAPSIDFNMEAANDPGPAEPVLVSRKSSFSSVNLRGKRQFTPFSVETHRPDNNDAASMETLPFFCGNPFVEKTDGILHIYKKSEDQTSKSRSKTLCMLAVPAVMSSHDLLQFLAPFGTGITQIRIIRDNSPNQYMVLVSFCHQEQADSFYENVNGIQYNSLESDLCHLAYVANIEAKKYSEGAGLPIEGHTELPTCPVCLERMDESVDGILTVLCNHSFHANCLNQWGDTSCPVCRYIQTPELTPEHKCSVCEKQEDLWICLICGNIGCGRYAEAHAVLHFQETQHTFSLEVGGQRVWDYAGDNYVHRLIQSKSDGKVVEFDSTHSEVSEEKLDGITLEYTYLLTNQLESQRLYFEDKVAKVEKLAEIEIDKWRRRVIEMEAELDRIRTELRQFRADKTQNEKRLQQIQGRLAKCQDELTEERCVNKMLRGDQQAWSDKIGTLEGRLNEVQRDKDKEIADLNEQLRDLMFHLEAESKLKEAAVVPAHQDSFCGQPTTATNEEVRDGRLEVGEAPPPPRKPQRRKNR